MSSLGSAHHLPCCALGALALTACHGESSRETGQWERAAPTELAAPEVEPPRGAVPTDDLLDCGRSVLRPRVPEVWDPILGRDRGVTLAPSGHRDAIFLDMVWAERDPHPTLYQGGGQRPLVALDLPVPREQPDVEREVRGCAELGGEQI
jgi:hypothetical protein